MVQQSLDITIDDAQAAVAVASEDTSGCLVKIHPLEIDSGTIQLTDKPFLVGRDATCQLCLQDGSISRRHAMIERRGGRYCVVDQRSTNGVFVNEQPVVEQVLKAGDRLRFGNYIYKFIDQVEAQYHETVYSMMTRDGLTGAYNKRYFDDVLIRDMERSQRHGHAMCLLLIDIDHFKQVNDTYGHLAGDDVLQELRSRIESVRRDDEVFARFGGEEFALLVGDGNVGEGLQTAERCRRVVASEPFQTTAGAIQVTISIGVAEYSNTVTLSRDELVALADKKLYEAKNRGRNRVCS